MSCWEGHCRNKAHSTSLRRAWSGSYTCLQVPPENTLKGCFFCIFLMPLDCRQPQVEGNQEDMGTRAESESCGWSCPACRWGAELARQGKERDLSLRWLPGVVFSHTERLAVQPAQVPVAAYRSAVLN